jgi:hypothetical protein
MSVKRTDESAATQLAGSVDEAKTRREEALVISLTIVLLVACGIVYAIPAFPNEAKPFLFALAFPAAFALIEYHVI